MPRGPKPLKSKLKKNEFYCVSCRGRVSVDKDDIRVKMIKNKKVGSIPALKGQCGKCDTNLTKFIKRSAAAKAKSEYGSK